MTLSTRPTELVPDWFPLVPGTGHRPPVNDWFPPTPPLRGGNQWNRSVWNHSDTPKTRRLVPDAQRATA